MNFFRNLLTNVVILFVVVSTAVFLYKTYKEPVVNYFLGDGKIGILVDEVALTVTVADTPEERRQGLSGQSRLPEMEGIWFVFDQEDYYGFWMKDMLIPIDIVWVNNDLKIVHIERDVRPDTYPTVFNPPEKARFVLEVNSHLTSTFNINVGDRILVPENKLPADLR